MLTVTKYWPVKDRPPPRRKRVAAYARVSSGKDAMLHSLSAQVSYFSDYIQNHPGWEYCGVYADQALTGTKDSRPEFQRMLADCRAGKIDMVLVKSISRFARNTVTLLETVRELRALRVDVYFQNENIHSISADGEFMISVLASVSQEESRSVSENVKWRVKKKLQRGQPTKGAMLGYRLVDDVYQIISEEAETVKLIFSSYLSGLGYSTICKKLNGMGISAPLGGAWNKNTVMQILRNITYTGDLLLQKTYVADHITKVKRINNGVLPKYHVSQSHEGIISREDFDRVQTEIRRRAERYHPHPQIPVQYPFTGKLRCQLCGKHYQRKVNGEYKKPIWICTTYNTLGKSACASKQIPESVLIAAAADALGLPMFDAAIFEERVDHILVPEANRLVFALKSGEQFEKMWRQPSRRDSWTPEMRQAARARQRTMINKEKSVEEHGTE